MLDRLLARCRAAKSRVLIFSQYTLTLDVLEEYAAARSERGRCWPVVFAHTAFQRDRHPAVNPDHPTDRPPRFGPKGSAFLRLDGSTNRIDRELDVRRFNASPNIFAYLIRCLDTLSTISTETVNNRYHLRLNLTPVSALFV